MSERIGLPEAARRVGSPYFRVWNAIAAGRVRAERDGPAGRYRVAVEDLPLLTTAVGAAPSEPATKAQRGRCKAAA